MHDPEPEREPQSTDGAAFPVTSALRAPEPQLQRLDDSGLDEYNWDDDMLFGAGPPPLQVLGAYSELPAFEMSEFEPPIRCVVPAASSA